MSAREHTPEEIAMLAAAAALLRPAPPPPREFFVTGVGVDWDAFCERVLRESGVPFVERKAPAR